MVKVYPNARFEADFPDDSEERDGDIVAFPGRNVAAAIAERLKIVGYKCEGPLEDGPRWGYHVNVRGHYMFFGVLAHEDNEFFVYSIDAFPPGRLLPWSKRRFTEYLRVLEDVLKADARFRNLRWFAAKDPDHKNPAPSAVDHA